MFACRLAVIKMQQAAAVAAAAASAAEIVVAAVVSALISLNMQITCTTRCQWSLWPQTPFPAPNQQPTTHTLMQNAP